MITDDDALLRYCIEKMATVYCTLYWGDCIARTDLETLNLSKRVLNFNVSHTNIYFSFTSPSSPPFFNYCLTKKCKEAVTSYGLAINKIENIAICLFRYRYLYCKCVAQD